MIGVVDWGIGGMWALRRMLEREPSTDVIYACDQGNTPYGLQSREQLAASVRALVERARQAGARRVLVACHSASSVLPDLPDDPGVHGVIVPEAVPDAARRVVVLAGARTVRSGTWRRALGDRLVVQRIAQPLSAAVEAGRAAHPETRAQLARILSPVGDVDAIVLACTHYAALATVVADLRPGVEVVDPALFVVDRLQLSPGSGRCRVLTTGRADHVRASIARALPQLGGLQVEEVR